MNSIVTYDILYMNKNNLEHARICVHNIKYHIVWSVKYHRKIITPEMESYMRDLVQKFANDKGRRFYAKGKEKEIE